MDSSDGARLRVLVADGQSGRFDQVTLTVRSLGHEVVASGELQDVPTLTASLMPDVALVIVSEGSEQALRVIRRIVRDASCPVIAILEVQDATFIKEAAKLGIFAYIADGHKADEFQSSIDIALRRFAEYHALEGAFGRRAVTERAKGILMERHAISEEAAFSMIREQARRTNRKIVDVAEALIETHRLLPGVRGHPEQDTEASTGARPEVRRPPE
jgi:response regulator NasT